MKTNDVPAVNKTIILAITSLSGFLTPFLGSSVNVALPAINRDYPMNAITLSWIATAYLLSATIFILPFGRLGDLYGRKRIFLWGTVIFLLASCLAAISWSEESLIFSRFIQGMGGGMLAASGTAILTSAFPPGERGRAMGLNVAAIYLGLSLGPFIGGIMTQYAGWRSIFWLNALLSLIILIFTLWKLHTDWAEADGERLDIPGSLIYAFGIISVIYGFSSLPDPQGILFVSAGILVLVFFILVEKKTSDPILDIKLFSHNRVFAFSSLAAFINYSATYAVTFLVSLYLQYNRGMQPQDAGLILVSMPIIQTIFSPLAGRLSDRIEPQVLASIGMGLCATGLLLLASLSADSPLWFLLINLMILGLGFALFSSPNTNAIMSSVENRKLGIASALLATMRMTGQMFSMGIAMLIIALFVGHVEISPANYPEFLISLKSTLVIFALLCTAGIFASLSRGKSLNN